MMIARSSARRRQANLLAASFAKLNLPWLAPAQLRWIATHSTSTTIASHRSRRRSTGQERREAAPLRRIGTSADVVSRSMDDGSLLATSQQPWTWQETLTSADRQLFGAKPIVIETASRNASFMRGNIALTKVHDMPELLNHLYTAVRIGRLRRGRLILQRLQTLADATSPELSFAHATYLEGCLDALQAHSTGSDECYGAFGEMQEWFQQQVLAKGVTISGQTLVHMVVAAIHATDGSEREEAIKSFVEIGRNISEDAHDEVLFSDEYNDEEFAILSKATDPAAAEGTMLEPMDISIMDTVQPHVEDDKIESAAKTIIQKCFQRPDAVDLTLIPEVAATDQLGLGLSDVKRALLPLADIPALPAAAPQEEQQAVAEARQRMMEQQSADIAVEKWRRADEDLKKMGINTSMKTKPIGALMWQWHQALVPVIREELELCRKVANVAVALRKDLRSSYAPYIHKIPAEKLAAYTIMHLLARVTSGRSVTSPGDQIRVTGISEQLGKFIEEEWIAQQPGGKLHSTQDRKQARSQSRRRAISKRPKQSLSPLINQIEGKEIGWPPEIQVSIGAMLMSLFMKTAEIPVTRQHFRTRERMTEMQPALRHTYKYYHGKKTGYLVPHEAFVDKLKQEPPASLITKRLPMVIEPKPWTEFKEGGYYHHKTAVVRLPSGETGCREYFRAAHDQGDLTQLYAGLTALGKIPWRVNLDVLRVQVEAWNTGEPFGNFAAADAKFDIPKEPEASADPSARTKWLRHLAALENRKHGLHAVRCFQNFQLEIARSMANDTLYFPHNIDFRGRVYPLPPYLNHMGADNARGLLTFGEGRPLGEEGLRWLKIHLANVAGYDKASLQEREDFTMEHLDDIRDAANNPMGGRRWWLKSEDAWQTLAACFELVHALDSPDPLKFVSHLPVHQDGTCNGLQHYAALGGDKAGALHVNLEPSDRPADVYTGVLDAVNEHVEADAAAGDPVALYVKQHAQLGRKVVKQPVMTNVYGVTRYGASRQIKKQIIDLFPEVGYDTEISIGMISTYLTTTVFKSLGSMFEGAHAIQTWLGTCASRISVSLTAGQISKLLAENAGKDKHSFENVELKSRNISTRDSDARKAFKAMFKSTVVWTTPLGLPVVQPYRKSASAVIKTSIQDLMVTNPQVWDPVHAARQTAAFSPNFIHSLDATHMMLSTLKCSEAGITFASIHDSFWTHASDVSKMSTILRDAFIKMHSDDIIGRLHDEFKTRYKDSMYLADIEATHPAARQVTAWRRANIHRISTRLSELRLETERSRLLASSDADERRQGEEMVTPASILDAAGYEGKLEQRQAAPSFALDAEAAADLMTRDEDSEQTSPPTRKRTSQSAKKMAVWRQLRFPSVPKKGDFDVRRLIESKYFFS